MKVLILGASYGSLLSTKLAMAGHDVTLVCREATAALINEEGTFVRLTLRDEDEPRVIASRELPGKVDAATPEDVSLEGLDLVALAMQEPQYRVPEVKALMRRIAEARVPCLSIMNMPPPPYLARIAALEGADLDGAFDDPSVWTGFEPALMTLCSPDPQAFRPPEEKANFLHVGLPTNFKSAPFGDEAASAKLRQLADDIAAVTIDGKDVPVKLRVHDSLFVPLAKWSMLMTGNYRCVTEEGTRSIRDAVHADVEESAAVYAWVDEVARKLGADAEDQVPFEKYARAAENLAKPSSAARALEDGATGIERVDRLVQLIAAKVDMRSDSVDRTVRVVDDRLAANAAS